MITTDEKSTSPPQYGAPIASGPNVPEGGDEIAQQLATFTPVKGLGGDQIPFCKPNVRKGREREDLLHYINAGKESSECLQWTCCLLFPCYALCKMQLINEGNYGFSMNNGTPEIIFAGRHFLLSPLNDFQAQRSSGDDHIEVGPISIVRVREGRYGLAYNNAQPEILLPGVHVRNSTAFKYSKSVSIEEEYIVHGPIKFLTVKSGEVRACYDKGKIEIFPEGRYAINSGAFRVAGTINTQQQNTRFSKHPVLLDGGIGLLVEGLLTYQVVDVEKLVRQLGDRDLARSIENVTKAEIARVFAGIHLEQISSATTSKRVGEHPNNGPLGMIVGLNDEFKRPSPVQPAHVLGNPDDVSGDSEGEERSRICQLIIQYITPITATWGVKIINFQLESTKIADETYAKEYEQASLGMAKAKANLRSVDAENEIQVRRAQAKARSVQIEAEGRRDFNIILAQGVAEARKIEFLARNEAAKKMSNEFARQYALSGTRVEFAGALKANVLTMLPENAVTTVNGVTGSTMNTIPGAPSSARS